MKTYDLLVIGGGLSGLCAAVHAAESGARVAVFEAGDAAKYPANSRYTGGVSSCISGHSCIARSPA